MGRKAFTPDGKITVVLFHRHVEYLDGVCTRIARKHGKSVNRSEVIGAIIEALGCRGEQTQVEELITSRIGFNPRRKLK